MMRSTLGAPLGGTTRGGHQGVDSLALSLITPPNFGGSGGICLPSIGVAVLGDPGVPVNCCAFAPAAANKIIKNNTRRRTNREGCKCSFTISAPPPETFLSCVFCGNFLVGSVVIAVGGPYQLVQRIITSAVTTQRRIGQ